MRSSSTSSAASSKPAAYTGPDVALAVDLLPREEVDDEEEHDDDDEAAGGDAEAEVASGVVRASLDEEAARVKAAMVRSGRRRRAQLLLQGPDGGARCSMAARAISLDSRGRAREETIG